MPDLDKILRNVNEAYFFAEYQPALGDNGDLLQRPDECFLPPADARPIILTPVVPPVINKDCQLPFTEIPAIPIPVVDVVIPGLACPDGISFSGTIGVSVNGGAPSPSTIVIEPSLGDACLYEMSGVIDVPIPDLACPDGTSVSGSVNVTIRDSVRGHSATITNALKFTNPTACEYVLGDNIDLDITTLIPDVPCPNGIDFDTKDFYIVVDDPNTCGTVKHNFQVSSGGSSGVVDREPVYVGSSVGSSPAHSVFYSVNKYDTPSHPTLLLEGGRYYALASWSGSPPSDFDIKAITNNGFKANKVNTEDDFFAAVGTNQACAISHDGKVWDYKASTTGLTALNAIAYGCERFVAVGDSGFIRICADRKGNAWSTPVQMSTAAGPITANIYGIVYTNNRFAIVGAGGKTYYSNDLATTWKLGCNSDARTLRAIASSGGKTIAVGDSGAVLISNDGGETWAAASSSTLTGAGNFTAITHNTKEFVAVTASSQAYVSPDGLEWFMTSYIPSVPTGANCLTSDGANRVVVGCNGMVIQARDGHTGADAWLGGAVGGVTGGNIVALDYRKGNRSFDEECKFSIFPPLTIKLPKVPCPDGITLLPSSDPGSGTGAIPIYGPGSTAVGYANLYFKRGGPCGTDLTHDSCTYTLAGSINITVPLGGGDPTPAGPPRWG